MQISARFRPNSGIWTRTGLSFKARPGPNAQCAQPAGGECIFFLHNPPDPWYTSPAGSLIKTSPEKNPNPGDIIMETQTDTTDTTDGRQQYDHDAIKADLALTGDDGKPSMSVREIADKHGCSPSLVQRIRRDEGNGGERTPRNVQRSVQLKKLTERLDKDLGLLAKWKKNEDKVTTEDGSPFTGVTTIIGVLEEAKLQLETAAELYEKLPDEVTKTKRAAAKVDFEDGMVVQAKEKYRETYEALCASPTHLTVRGKRDTHVLVEDTEGQRFFVASKELEPRPSDA